MRVFRPDAEWLLSVRHGALSYEQVLTLAAEHERGLTLIATSPLPEEPDVRAANDLLISLQEDFLAAR